MTPGQQSSTRAVTSLHPAENQRAPSPPSVEGRTSEIRGEGIRRARVCIYQRYLPPDPSGAGKQAVTLSRALRELGFDPVLLGDLPEGAVGSDQLAGIPVEWIDAPPANPTYPQLLAYWGRLASRLFSLRDTFDLLHVHSAAFQQSAAVPIARLLRKPVLVRSSIAGEFEGLARSKSGRIQRRAMTLCDRFVVLSENLAREFRGAGLPADRLQLIPNGVDEETYHPVAVATKRALRGELDLPLDDRIIVFHGVFIERKSVHWLIDTLGPSLEQLGLTLLLVGGGARDEAATGYAAGVERQVACSPWRNRIVVRGFDARVERYLQAADLYVLPSTAEGLSNALLEAMATGLVPLVSRTSGSEDVIEEGVSGFLFEPRNEASLLRELQRALATDLSSCSRAAVERVTQEYGIGASARRYAELYRSMLQ